ncbi:plakophilin-3 isoform X1 [Oncorhynchus tshawytscha]|uniref:Plakophilin 3b n=2 Tax=Oncorhynchus tshawytscha TaxID=74940 RepID=A0A8C8CJP8_ONCTS|nr:plakophilin-3 isoform X1 [Oncorhynchus tshawytscha]
MSATVASESCFLSALQPITAVTTYAVPSDVQLGPRGSIMDEVERAKRVQQQVNLRLAEKKYSTLTRLNVSNCISPDHGGTMRYNTYNPGFSSKSMVYNTGSWTMKMPPVSQQYLGGGYSSRSAVELGPRYRISQPPVNIGYLHHDDIQLGGYQTSRTRTARSRSVCQADQEAVVQGVGGLFTLPHQQPNPVASWVARDGMEIEFHSYHGGGIPAPATMRRTLSGTLAGDGSGGWREAELVYQPSYRGPAHRTISRINNRQQQQQQLSSASGLQQWQQVSGGGSGSVYGGWGQYQNSLPRLASFHSMKSVEKGMDVPDGGSDSANSNQKLRGMHSLDMPTAVNYLFMSNTAMQMLGAAYIQHQCYHSSDAKNQVRLLKGVPALVQLFSSDSQEVQCYATGATRNLIYENMDNKAALIEAEGITKLISVLNEPDEELRKNITGILWNMSSKESLKEKLARETLSELTERVLVPLCSGGDSELIRQSPSEADIFYNISGCLRNLSSVNERTRQQMRDMRGLVDSLVAYIQNSLQDEKSEDKGVENAVCVLRNLSYQLYSEIPPSTLLRLEGPTWARATTGTESIGCFTPQSKKAKERRNQELSTSEVAKQPKGAEWLWHPQVVGLYNRVLQHYEANTATREAAAGALQNITARETRWASVLSWVALEQERMLPVVLDLLQTQSDQEMCSLTGLLWNLSRHSRNKNDMATKVVNVLVTKLPSDGHQKEPSGEVVVNICGILNNLVAGSSLAARDITFFDGLPKLVAIKSSHNSSSGKLKAAKAASTVLLNMFQYNKLHKDYKQKGFTKCDFTDTAI